MTLFRNFLYILCYLSFVQLSFGPVTINGIPAVAVKKNIVVAFDLHGVLFNVSTKGVMKTLWNTPKKLSLIKLMLTPSFRKQYKATKKLALSTEQRMKLLMPTFPELQKYKKYFIELCNQQDINQDVLAFIRKLKSQGYHLVIASNIGEETYQELVAKYPILKELFEYAFTSGKISGYAKKSSPLYFDRLKALVKEKYMSENIIFIDDHAAAVASACAKNINGIVFVDAAQVSKDFDTAIALINENAKK